MHSPHHDQYHRHCEGVKGRLGERGMRGEEDFASCCSSSLSLLSHLSVCLSVFVSPASLTLALSLLYKHEYMTSA